MPGLMPTNRTRTSGAMRSRRGGTSDPDRGDERRVRQMRKPRHAMVGVGHDASTEVFSGRSLGEGGSADAGQQSPLYGLTVPDVLRVAAQRLLFIESADDKGRVSYQKHRSVPS